MPSLKEKPQLIMHIGGPKAGSTSLQQTFEYNRNLLYSQDVFYPTTKPCYGKKLNFLLNSEAIENIIGTDKNVQETLKYNIEKSVNEVLLQFQKSHCNKILISDELLFHFYFLNKATCPDLKKITHYQYNELLNNVMDYKLARLKYLFRNFHTKIVCYLRRQDMYMESGYNQICKQFDIEKVTNHVRVYDDIYKGYNHYSFPKLDESSLFFVACPHLFLATYYYNVLSTWVDIFGKENIIVKPFEKDQLQGGLVNDFFINVLNIGSNKLTNLKEIHVNERISRDVLEHINSLGMEKRPKYINNNDLVEISQKLGNVNRYQNYLTVDERIRLLEHHREGNEKIAREYLGRKDGRLFYEEAEMVEPEPYPGLTPEKIAILDEEFKRMEVEYKRKRRSIVYQTGRCVKKISPALYHVARSILKGKR